MAIREAYKIVEVGDDGKIRTLFHGVGHSRAQEQGKWIEANVKNGQDGKGTSYLTGFHSLPTYEAAQDYLKRFNTRTEKLRIVRCLIHDVWKKKHSPHEVLLSRWIFFCDIDLPMI